MTHCLIVRITVISPHFLHSPSLMCTLVACENGTYGPGCTGDCPGRCLKDYCNAKDGLCLDGCMNSTYKGPYCTECECNKYIFCNRGQ